MNKLTTIYNVMKNMKDFEKLAAEVEVKIKKEDETLVEVNKSFDRRKEGKAFKNTASIKVVHGEESFEHQFSSIVNEENLNHFGKGHGCIGGVFGHHKMMRGMMEGEKAHFPMKNKLQKFMLMIDLLNKAELEKLEDGSKKLSLKLDEDNLTDELKEAIKHKRMHRHHMMHMHGKGNRHGGRHGEMSKEELLEMKKKHHMMGILNEDMELKGLKAEFVISDKDYIENVEINLELGDNEDKDIKVALKGNVKDIG